MDSIHGAKRQKGVAELQAAAVRDAGGEVSREALLAVAREMVAGARATSTTATYSVAQRAFLAVAEKYLLNWRVQDQAVEAALLYAAEQRLKGLMAGTILGGLSAVNTMLRDETNGLVDLNGSRQINNLRQSLGRDKHMEGHPNASERVSGKEFKILLESLRLTEPQQLRLAAALVADYFCVSRGGATHKLTRGCVRLASRGLVLTFYFDKNLRNCRRKMAVIPNLPSWGDVNPYAIFQGWWTRMPGSDDTSLIFGDLRTGAPIKKRSMDDQITKQLAKVFPGRHFTRHGLRHGGATELRERGLTPMEVRDYGGWMGTPDTYLHGTDDSLFDSWSSEAIYANVDVSGDSDDEA